MTRLVLVRHGRTAWNAEGRWQGQTDVPLDDTGRAQAAAMAVEIAARFSATSLYASDLARAWETAGFVAAATGLTPVAEPLLREIFTGEWEGKLVGDIEDRWPTDYHRWIAGEDFTRAGGAETRAEVAERTVRGLQRVIAATPSTSTTVVVGHGASLRAGTALLTGLPSSNVTSLGSLRNCHWVELTDAASGSPALAFGRSAGWVIESWNVGGGAHRPDPDAAVAGSPGGAAVAV